MSTRAGTLLEQKHTVDLVLFIRDKGEIKLTDFDERGWTTVNKRLRSLVEAGVICERQRRTGRNVTLYSLTRKGHMIADHLRDIDSILCGEIDLEGQE